MENQPRVLSADQHQNLLTYLSNQPYKAVASAIAELSNIPTVEQFTKKEEKTEAIVFVPDLPE